MSFYTSQAVLFALQLGYAFATFLVGVCLSTDEIHSALNRTVVVLQIVLYWCFPVLIAAFFPTRLERGLSDEKGVRLLEELALWAIVGDVFVRPLLQLLKALACVVLITRATDRSVRLKTFLSHIVRDMFEGGRQGLLNIGWLTSWRILKELREEVKANAQVSLIIVGAIEFWLPPDACNAGSNQCMVDLTWLYDDEACAPTEERLGDSS